MSAGASSNKHRRSRWRSWWRLHDLADEHLMAAKPNATTAMTERRGTDCVVGIHFSLGKARERTQQ
jgi:hypothetical protein